MHKFYLTDFNLYFKNIAQKAACRTSCKIKKISTLSFMLCQMMLTSPVIFAQTLEQDTETDPVFISNSDTTHLQSTQILQSLHDVPKVQQIHAPYVQELYTQQKVRTLFVETHSLPIVDIQLTFNAGSARDESIKKGLFGLANLTAQLLDDGTSHQSADEIAQNFERLGAEFSAQAYRDMFIIKLRVLSDPERLQPALQQLIDIITDQSVSQSSLDRIFNNASVGQKQVKEDPSRLMNVRFYRSLYGEHPYAEPVTGTMQSLKRIQPKDIEAFRQRYLVANNLNLAITGNLNTIQAKKIADSISESLPTGEVASALPDATLMEKSKIISLPFDSSQAHVMLGTLSITQKDPDRFALEVGHRILASGGFNSLLTQALREQHGYTYNVSSNFNTLQSQGLFYFQYATQREQLLASIEVAYQTLLDFLYRPIDEQRVEDTKTGMLRAFPQIISSNASINAQLGLIGFYGFSSQYLNEYPTYISSVNAQDIQKAWQKHLDPQRMLTIVAGKNISGDEIANIYRRLMTEELKRQHLIQQDISSSTIKP